jgi:spermidine/putrescine transport system substrate-binding protein
MLVPNMAEHKANVETMMNFYYDPVNAAKLAAWNYYFCPVKGAQQKIGQFDKSAVHSEFIFPSQKILANGHAFKSLDQKTEQSYQTQFNGVMGG